MSNHNPPGNGHSDDDFIMPEHDPNPSGQPITDTVYHASTAGPSGQAAKTFIAQQDNQQGSAAQQIMGLTIKNKLLGSFFLLTVFISGMGAYSYATLVEVSSLSEIVAQDQARLAKLSEEIKTTVYKIRDAEKDFTYLEEAESFDRVTRYTAHIRVQLKEILVFADVLGKKLGKSVGEEFASISELVDSYEAQFANQVKSIQKARQEVNDDIESTKAFKEQLLVEVSSNRLITENLVGDYWIDLKAQMNDAATTTGNRKEDVAGVSVGVTLSELQQSLLNLQIQTAKYFDTGKSSFTDTSQAYVLTAKSQANQVRINTLYPKVAQKMGDITNNLSNYGNLLNEVIATDEKVSQKKALVDQRIKDQLVDLRSISNQLLEQAERVSVRSWGQVNELSNSLSSVSASAQTNLLLLALTGTLFGIGVLVWIPRPILGGINQLLQGAQRVANGDLSKPVNVASRDELGQLAYTFDMMRNNLQSLVLRSQTVSVQISSSINEIQAAANQQASTSNEQAATISQFKATMGEMSRTANELNSLVAEISVYAEKVSEHVSLSNDKSSRLLESMSNISESTQQTSGRIKSLNDQMDTINDAVTVISGVADQTTLLSMNASIEANKAGEMGKGFSVVAYEIRRLSDRAIDSAGDITGKVRDIQRATENSVVAMDKSSEEIRLGISQVQESTDTLANINNSLNTIRDQMGDMNSSTKDQAMASNQAEQSATELAKSSLMVSSAAKQTVAAAFEINAMANQLAESVAAFRT